MKVFLSYSRLDKEAADEISAAVEAAGHDVWLDRADIRPGDRWRNEIVAAIRGCDVFLLLISRHSMASENVTKEVVLAAQQDRPIVPLELEQVPLPDALAYDLSEIHRIRVDGRRRKAGIASLLRTLGADDTTVQAATAATVDSGRSPLVPGVFIVAGIAVVAAAILIVVLYAGGGDTADPGDDRSVPTPTASTATPTPIPATPEPTEPAVTPVPPPGPIELAAPSITTARIDEQSAAPAYSIIAEFPVVSGIDDRVAVPVNERISETVQGEIEAFQAVAADIAESPGAGAPFLEMSTRTTLATDRLLSVRFTSVVFTGGANVDTVVFTLSFDLMDGSELAFNDIFSSPDTLFTLQQRSIERVIADIYGGQGDQFPPDAQRGLDPLPSNFDVIGLAPDGLQITFERFQIGPGALGAPTITIPWSELGGVIAPSSAVADLVP